MTKGNAMSGTHNVVPITVNGNKVITGPVQEQAWCKPFTKEANIISPFLFDILTQSTPYGHEELIVPFLENYVAPHVLQKDAFGNRYVIVGNREEVTTMFSCHLDTVHTNTDKLILMHTEGSGDVNKDGFIYASKLTRDYEYKFPADAQRFSKWKLENDLDKWFGRGQWKLVPDNDDPDKLIIWATEGAGTPFQACESTYVERILLKERYEPSILGADDKVGVYICGRLIRNNTPGLYVFHLGEEKGGQGSSWIKNSNPDFVKGIKRCIAFDRMHYDDVIAHQAGGRTASAEFTNALAAAINAGLTTSQVLLKGDQRGVWTDSANYTGLISECTNVSVGYFKQHWTAEHFDYIWVDQFLIPALLKVDFEALPAVRAPDPKSSAIKGNTSTTHYGRGWGGTRWLGNNYYGTADEDDGLDEDAAAEQWLAEYTKATKTVNCRGQIPISPKWVDKDTELDKLPDWKPGDGWLTDATEEGMVRIVWGYLLNSQKATTSSAEEIVRQLRAYNDLLDRIVDVRQDLSETKQHLAAMTHLNRQLQLKADDAEQALADKCEEFDKVKAELADIAAQLAKLRSLH